VELRLALTHLQEFAAQVEKGLDRADWSTRRQVIRALVKRVEIAAKEIRIVYRIAPVPFVERPLDGGVLEHCPRRSPPLEHNLECNQSSSAICSTWQRLASVPT
jgi:site-specific DNA recombinase